MGEENYTGMMCKLMQWQAVNNLKHALDEAFSRQIISQGLRNFQSPILNPCDIFVGHTKTKCM
jgi:hypothetical protein